MTTVTERVIAVLDRFNRDHPWSHNAHYHGWILRRLPARPRAALDVGCGAGDLARLLATRAAAVHGIDADPRIIAVARDRTDPAAPVGFTVGDALTDLPPGPFDAITCVAAVHHMPFAEALTRMRERLAPGGTLLIVGLAVPATLLDHLLTAVAVPCNLVMGWVRNSGRRAARPVAVTAPVAPPTMTFAEITRQARDILPGARLRRRLFWRYTLAWRRPA